VNRPRPTIKDVARAAGVHYSTVSLALREHPSIPPKTRERIQKAVTEVGYVRDPSMAALSQFRSGTRLDYQPPRIAYLTNRTPENGFRDIWVYQQLLEGARAQTRALGYEMDVLHVGPGYHNSESLEAHLKAHGFVGVILASFTPGFAELTLPWENFSLVKIDSLHMPPECPFVSFDQLRAVRLCMQRLLALGYRRIGMAVGQADEESMDHRHSGGLLIEQESLPAESRIPPLLFPHHADAKLVSGLIGRWARQHKLDAILCNWTNLLSLLRHAGLRVPRDVGCACLCLDQPSRQLAGIMPDMRLVGAKAVSVLAAQLRSGQRGVPAHPPISYVQGTWYDGASAPQRNV
jgi:LacI family transcriptional regulator